MSGGGGVGTKKNPEAACSRCTFKTAGFALKTCALSYDLSITQSQCSLRVFAPHKSLTDPTQEAQIGVVAIFLCINSETIFLTTLNCPIMSF